MNDMSTVWLLQDAMARRFPTDPHAPARTARPPRRRSRWLRGTSL